MSGRAYAACCILFEVLLSLKSYCSKRDPNRVPPFFQSWHLATARLDDTGTMVIDCAAMLLLQCCHKKQTFISQHRTVWASRILLSTSFSQNGKRKLPCQQLLWQWSLDFDFQQCRPVVCCIQWHVYFPVSATTDGARRETKKPSPGLEMMT